MALSRCQKCREPTAVHKHDGEWICNRCRGDIEAMAEASKAVVPQNFIQEFMERERYPLLERAVKKEKEKGAAQVDSIKRFLQGFHEEYTPLLDAIVAQDSEAFEIAVENLRAESKG